MIYFFFHVPKTAGTSFKRALETWFETQRDVDLDAPARAALAAAPGSDLCVHGHFGGRLAGSEDSLLSRYPFLIGNADARVLTLLRDPVAQAVSFYRHEVRRGRATGDLADFLRRLHEFSYRRIFGLRGREEIDPLLASFWFAGPSEDLQGCIDRIAERLNRPPPVAALENFSDARQVIELSPDDRRAAERVFDLECELYARVRDNFKTGAIMWRGGSPFDHISQNLTCRPSAQVNGNDAPDGVARLLSLRVHALDGETRKKYDVGEAVCVSFEFEINSDEFVVEPALAIAKDGETVFVAAYTPLTDDRGPSRFSVGRHSAAAIIPPNLLNVGYFEISGSLSCPYPVKRFDQTLAPARIRIVETEAKPGLARGAWRTAFPGAVRPALHWSVE